MFEALLDAWKDLDDEMVSRAPEAAAELPLTSMCANEAWLAQQVAPPEDAATQAAVGHSTVTAIRELRADLAFVGTNGISVDHGLSTPDPEEAATKRALVANAQRVVALSDASKVGQERTVRFAALEDIDVLVTDDGITEADAKSFEAAGLEVVRA